MAQLNSVLKLTLLDQVTGPVRRVSGAISALNRQQTAMMAPLRGFGAQMLAFGAGYIGVSKGISSTVGAAMDFESAFADVKKVVNASDAQFEVMSRSIRKMSTELPLASTEIAQLFAAAGESGIATNELQSFAEMAARVGIAFDMSAGEAGESLAKLKAQLGLTVAETGEMADAINHLSNNMASKAKDITAYMLRVGKFAEMSGFAKEQVAAIGSAMISAGAEAETAGTATMNVVRKMTAGEFAKKDQQEAARALGLDLPTLAKQMKKDAPRALKTVLKAIAKAPAEKQIALLSKFFGDEARAFAPLVGNIGLLDKAFDLVADRSNYAGSAFREFTARADTTANALQILRNKIGYVFEDIGLSWLPALKEGIADFGHVMDTLDSRFTIFDEFKSRIGGFLSGLGLGDGKDVIKDIRDFIFGAEDASAAADKYGRLFGQFQEYGKSLREFAKDIADNPVGRFLGDLAGKGFKLALAAGSISLVAGAITALATGLAKITGITTAIGILRTVSKIGGILSDVKVPTLPGDSKNKPAPEKPSSGGTGWKGFLALFQMFDAYANMPSTKEGIEELYKKNRDGSSGFNKWLDSKITTPSEWFRNRFVNDNSSHPYLNKDYDDGGRESSLDAYLGKDGTKDVPSTPAGWPSIFDKRWWFGAAADPNFNSRQHFGVETKAGGESGGSPRTTGEMLAGLDKPVTLDGPTISQLLQPSRGVQDVRVTNKQAPELRQTNNFYITEVSNAKDVAAAVMSDIGQASKAAVEAADTD
ncbi:phage tail tape measure protein [Shinella yambaruensis]|uniref:Phage tail tape measure protein domain-containing protein n=1 Tax=Shinella yambaruensis TaxID=415996 RepID=A0ABQ5ZCH8_9HYPH|nr:phage tail tape measure protein [Shinella yambaruensis]MCJ8024430.1 phage tail tape measure protein [Shinella yambaruensis]MCU7980872.1 phage tail tape measure protein [Shinella yambaruensis]GLR49731.1 hypothetical protein GCM10007923_09360 [Shinella yambaruensis]